MVDPPSKSSGSSHEPAASAIGKSGQPKVQMINGKEILAGKKVEFDHRPVVVSVESTLQRLPGDKNCTGWEFRYNSTGEILPKSQYQEILSKVQDLLRSAEERGTSVTIEIPTKSKAWGNSRLAELIKDNGLITTSLRNKKPTSTFLTPD